MNYIQMGIGDWGGYASMNFSSTCLWNPNQDGSVTVKYENDKMHAFVCLFGLAP